jgi:hypothetical protein
LSHVNPISIPPSYLSSISILSFYLRQWLPTDLFPSSFLIEISWKIWSLNIKNAVWRRVCLTDCTNFSKERTAPPCPEKRSNILFLRNHSNHLPDLGIQEVTVSNLSQDTGYPDWYLSWFSSAPPGKC